MSVRKNYEYRLTAKDDTDLKSSSKIIKTKPVDSRVRSLVQNFVGQLLQNPKRIVLQWDYANDPDLVSFEIFRAINDVTKQRTYSFLTIPPGPAPGTSSNGGTTTLNGNTWHCVFTDGDVKFALKHMNAFVAFPNPNDNPNQAIPVTAPPQQGATSSTFVVPNPNNMAGQQQVQPALLHYWVMAKYANGGYSPVGGPVQIAFQ